MKERGPTMDIRTMEYYLAVVREGTISGAAGALHVAQPSLSRQMRDLERELGVTLFTRGNRRITLTEEGRVLRRRAEEMVRLMELTHEEIAQSKDHVMGTVRVGAGESHAFHHLSRAAAVLHAKQPGVSFEVTSGDTQDIMDELEGGLIDLALVFTEPDRSQYQTLVLPVEDRFGVLMPRSCELASKVEVSYADLEGLSVIVSRAAMPLFSGMDDMRELNVVATYNLVYNASLMVEDGLGYAICFDRLVNTTGESPLCMRPLVPEVLATGTLMWKRYQPLSPAVRMFVDEVRRQAESFSPAS